MQPRNDSPTLLRSSANIHAGRRSAPPRQKPRRLECLLELSRTAAAGVDRDAALNMILRVATTELRLDAAAILRLDPGKGLLEPVSYFALPAEFEKRRVLLGAEFGGRAARDLRPVTVSDCTAPCAAELVPGFAAIEGFQSCWALPLLAGDRSLGVFEIYSRRRRVLDTLPRVFLEALAEHAAIALALDDARMTCNRMAGELTIAQDLAMQGWCRTLELRDPDTQAHSRRVAPVAVALSRALGVHESHLIHIHRGALLHDIGKIAVPDRILSKPGPLTPEEWQVMRRHPGDALELLYSADFLKPALEIPYCHHEKWDGTGYPRGLRGADIPMAARIFSVVDVWDALGSKRPYGSVWSPSDIRGYLQQEAGTHFDPAVVDAFLRLDASLLPAC